MKKMLLYIGENKKAFETLEKYLNTYFELINITTWDGARVLINTLDIDYIILDYELFKEKTKELINYLKFKSDGDKLFIATLNSPVNIMNADFNTSKSTINLLVKAIKKHIISKTDNNDVLQQNSFDSKKAPFYEKIYNNFVTSQFAYIQKKTPQIIEKVVKEEIKKLLNKM